MVDVTGPIGYEGGQVDENVEILGEVIGKAKATSFLGLFAGGDASINSAYYQALSKIPGSEFLIDVKIDYKVSSMLGLFASYTTIVQGKAARRLRGTMLTKTESRSEPKPKEGIGTQSERTEALVTKSARVITNQPDQELLAFRIEVEETLDKNYKLRRQFFFWAKNKNLDGNFRFWARSLSQEMLQDYKDSGLSMRQWLKTIFQK